MNTSGSLHARLRRRPCQPYNSDTKISHVLAGRKDLSLSALTTALARVGYRLRIVPAAKVKC